MGLQRERCEFEANDPVSKTVDLTDTNAPVIPPGIKHVIVLMRENRSFDHYLGAFTPEGESQFDWAVPPNVTNPDPSDGSDVPRHHELHYCTRDANHEWGGTHLQFNNGKMDGFVASNNMLPNNRGGCLAMGYYTEEDLPLYYWLARNFAISDAYFSSLLGPTLPNLMFYYRATACGATDNHYAVYAAFEECTSKTIFDRMDEANPKVSYRVYSGAPLPLAVPAATLLNAYHAAPGTIEDFSAAVAANQLEEVVFIEPNYGQFGGTQNDEHPDSNVQTGQRFVLEILSTLISNDEVWGSSVVFITWDEHGGYYDHVPPPSACAPEESAVVYDFAFDHLGIRVPFFVVSPFAKRGYISHYTADHASITRFIEAWKGLGALTRRDANAWPLLDMFDPLPRTDIVLPPFPNDSQDPVHVLTCQTGNTGSSCDVP